LEFPDGCLVRLDRHRLPDRLGADRGEVWTARAYEDEVIAERSIVDIVEIRGATAWVME
jgi:hypothetical protein